MTTLEQLRAMSDEEISALAAEKVMRWRWVRRETDRCNTGFLVPPDWPLLARDRLAVGIHLGPVGDFVCDAIAIPNKIFVKNAPKYSTDANAAREVEAEIERRSKASDADPTLAERYAIKLTELVSPDWNGVTAELCHADLFRIAHASARRRCEAAILCLSETERSDGK